MNERYNTKHKTGVDMENLRKKNQTGILEIKIPFSQTKNAVGATPAD
jgi:hypothetical protein